MRLAESAACVQPDSAVDVAVSEFSARAYHRQLTLVGIEARGVHKSPHCFGWNAYVKLRARVLTGAGDAWLFQLNGRAEPARA